MDLYLYIIYYSIFIMLEEFIFILFYISGFGFSDYLVNYLNLKGNKLLLYYFIILLIGLYLLYELRYKQSKIYLI